MFMSRTLQTFFGDFQLDILLNVPNDFQKACFSFVVG